MSAARESLIHCHAGTEGSKMEQRFFCVHLRVVDVGEYEDSADIAGEIADDLRDLGYVPESVSELRFAREAQEATG